MNSYIRTGKRSASLLLGLILLASTVSIAQSSVQSSVASTTLNQSRLLRLEADSTRGFNFPYFIFLPAGTPLHDTLFLLVEPNNTGLVNDTMAVHERAARYAARTSSVGNSVAKALHVPLLVPIFPRPYSDSLTYTHALDRDAVLIAQGHLKRLDLQLLAMIDDAQTRLDSLDITLHKKVLLTGFSASGTFVNRLTLIHPDRVAAVACGGINAMPILPTTTLHDAPLAYPLGLHDFQERFGKAPDLNSYRQVPQFLYMGEHDENDAVLFDDAYSDEDRNRVFSVIGKTMLPDRWAACAAAYEAAGATARFKTYSGIGHGTNGRINAEVAQFFRTAVNLPASSATKQPVQTPISYTGRQIRAGSGGGFTGASTTYYLLDNGQLFSKQSRDTTYTSLGKLTTTNTKRLFAAVETSCQIRTTRFNKPGNLYRFLGWQQGEQAYKLTWGAAGTTVPGAYAKTYALFMNLLPTAARPH